MSAWVQALERLDGPARDRVGQPVPFPRERVIPYAFRHSFAQRHADAGTPVDTLKELLGHDTVRTTLGYYRNPRELHQAGEKPQVSWSEQVPNWFRSPTADAC